MISSWVCCVTSFFRASRRGLQVQARHRHQRARRVVGPPVVRAGEINVSLHPPDTPSSRGNNTRVQKRANRAIRLADHQNRIFTDIRCEEVTATWNLRLMTQEIPRTREDLLNSPRRRPGAKKPLDGPATRRPRSAIPTPHPYIPPGSGVSAHPAAIGYSLDRLPTSNTMVQNNEVLRGRCSGCTPTGSARWCGRPAAYERHEPVGDRDEQREDRPEQEPDDVGDRERQAEEDGEPWSGAGRPCSRAAPVPRPRAARGRLGRRPGRGSDSDP